MISGVSSIAGVGVGSAQTDIGSGVVIGGVVGTCVVPDANEVLAPTVYGPANNGDTIGTASGGGGDPWPSTGLNSYMAVLSSSITDTQTVIPVNFVPPVGITRPILCMIDNEHVSFTGTTGTPGGVGTLTGVSRGLNGTSAVPHPAGVMIQSLLPGGV